jgi:enoyl-CoA hydratase/carnithine racemase
LPGALGELLALTGYRCSAADLLYCGLATHFVAEQKRSLLVEALQTRPLDDLPALLSSFCVRSRESVPFRCVPPSLSLAAATTADEPSLLCAHRADIDRIFSADTVEAMVVALQNEGAWATPLLEALRHASPSSLKVSSRRMKPPSLTIGRRCRCGCCVEAVRSRSRTRSRPSFAFSFAGFLGLTIAKAFAQP